MSVTTVGSGILNRTIGWLRAGYPPVGPQRGHIALLALYSAILRLLASFGCTPHRCRCRRSSQSLTIDHDGPAHHTERGHPLPERPSENTGLRCCCARCGADGMTWARRSAIDTAA